MATVVESNTFPHSAKGRFVVSRVDLIWCLALITRKKGVIPVGQGKDMNKSDLIEELSKSEDLTKAKAEEIVNLVFAEMANALVAGDRVELRGLGSFKVKNYDGYKGRNPKTGKQIKVKSKKLPFFKCGKELKERVDI